jgi:hypothetical protein
MSLSRLTLLLFVTLQVADGLITYGAASLFGTAAEGNPILAGWMHILGIGPAILLAKLAACAAGVLLYWRGVQTALAALTVLYAFGAVIPWLRILSTSTW